MPDAPTGNPWAEAIKNFRDVTRWIMGAIAGAVSLLFGSSPLTNLGSMHLGDPRLRLAGLGAFLGLIGLGVPFWFAVEVLRSRMMDIRELATRDDLARARERTYAVMGPRLPEDIHSFAELMNEYLPLYRQYNHDRASLSQDQFRRFRELDASVAQTRQLAQFEDISIRFVRMCRILAPGIFVALCGLGLFAWAANPPKDTKPAADSDRPQTIINVGTCCAKPSNPAPSADLAPVNPTPSVVSGPLVFRVYFNWDSDALDQKAMATLKDVVDAYHKQKVREIGVVGYADLSGKQGYNQQLSKRRADAVTRFLVDGGIPSHAIDTSARGQSNPRVPTAGGAREDENRRVEIVLSGPD